MNNNKAAMCGEIDKIFWYFASFFSTVIFVGQRDILWNYGFILSLLPITGTMTTSLLCLSSLHFPFFPSSWTPLSVILSCFN